VAAAPARAPRELPGPPAFYRDLREV